MATSPEEVSLAGIRAIFSDVGGVLITNGWGRPARQQLVETFRLDGADFEDRHELVATAFETGQLGLEHYLDRTIFCRARSFSREDVKSFMFARSRELPGTLGLMDRLAQTKKFLLATLNNESRELNLYRIERFGLRNTFTAFFSSGFLGVKKPDEAIYRRALDISQQAPEECVFVDDRPLNLECARRLGMRTIQFESPAQLERDLCALGVEY